MRHFEATKSHARCTAARAPVRLSQVSEGAAGVGSEYELVTLFKGNESTMKCEAAGTASLRMASHCTADSLARAQVHRGTLGPAQQGARARRCAVASLR